MQRQETLERERMMKQEAMELRQEAALREEKMWAREELSLAKEKAQAEIKARNKQFKRQATSSSNRIRNGNENADSADGINGKTGVGVPTGEVVSERYNG